MLNMFFKTKFNGKNCKLQKKLQFYANFSAKILKYFVFFSKSLEKHYKNVKKMCFFYILFYLKVFFCKKDGFF